MDDRNSAPEVGSKIAVSETEADRIKVFAHLARDKEALRWSAERTAGTLVGINDETPYGYGRAARMGCQVTFSRSDSEGLAIKVIRLGLRVILGFDVVHAYRQRHVMSQADVVWTHTESQFLAVAAVLRGRLNTPLLLGQSVWLFDRWPSLNLLRRALYRRLIQKVDVLTVHSDDNLAVARSLFPQKRIERVLFGIASENPAEPVPRSCKPIRVMGLGNDRDRDWTTLVQATQGQDGTEVVIFSGTANPKLAKNVPNVSIRSIKSNAEFQEQLAASTVMCVPLSENKHASGITVIQEAVLAGLPVIASDTGGLRGYFGPNEIYYVPPGDVTALQEAILTAGREPERMLAMAQRAQERMRVNALGAESYVRRHVEISCELLAERQRLAGSNGGASKSSGTAPRGVSPVGQTARPAQRP